MLLGNRRFVAVLAVGVAVGGVLSGCSATSGALSPVTAVAIGQQALGFTSSDSSPSTGPGWTSRAPCPDSLKPALTAQLPAGSTVSTLDPTAVSGPLLDPELTADDVATCAFALAVNGHRLNQLYFIGMDDGAASVITSKLVSDGFTAGATTTSGAQSQQVYTSTAGGIAISRGMENGEPIFIVSG